MLRTSYRGIDVVIKEGPLSSMENRSFSELLDCAVWNRFGYRLAGGSFHRGDLHVGFDTGCSVSWQEPVAKSIMRDFHIDKVFVDGIEFCQ